MYYDAELKYLKSVLQKMRLPVESLTPRQIFADRIDIGIRESLGMGTDYEWAIKFIAEWAKERTVYKTTDVFGCSYVFLLLPDQPEMTLLLVGPYLPWVMTTERLLAVSERLNLPAERLDQLRKYCANVTVLADDSAALIMIHTFAETLWGSESSFEVIDAANDSTAKASVSFISEGHPDEQDILMNMKLMEARYAHENELMDIVAKGHTRRAELMMSGFTTLAFEQRMTDPVRNLKNYAIICNTILRKAAERGGVHPIHLDRISSDYAGRIELLTGFESGYALMREMVREYCRLVRKLPIRRYSPPVQKAVTCIEEDLTGDLSLRALAELQNISPGYLSASFRKETGKTLTEYVNEARVEEAVKLLSTTKLQIQTIARHCGMSDLNYFTKLFKRYRGVTPKQFRESEHLYTGRVASDRI